MSLKYFKDKYRLGRAVEVSWQRHLYIATVIMQESQSFLRRKENTVRLLRRYGPEQDCGSYGLTLEGNIERMEDGDSPNFKNGLVTAISFRKVGYLNHAVSFPILQQVGEKERVFIDTSTLSSSPCTKPYVDWGIGAGDLTNWA